MPQDYTDTTVSNIILNDMTEAQFSNLQSVDPDQLYLTEDESANQDLSNLSPTGQKVLDGKWVNAEVVLSQATVQGTYTIDISSYLPSDNYQYEILIDAQVASSTACYTEVATSIANVVTGVSVNNSSQRSSAILPVDTDRLVYYRLDNSDAGYGSYLRLRAYRRIGTNQ